MSELRTNARVVDLLDLIDDLIRDNNLTCNPHPANPRCMCSTARALRLLKESQQTQPPAMACPTAATHRDTHRKAEG